MTLTLHAVRNAIQSTATDYRLRVEPQFLRKPSNCKSTLNLCPHRSWSRSLYIEASDLSCGINRGAYGGPCLTTRKHTLFNSKQRDWEDKHRRSSMLRCEMERKGQRDSHSEQTPGREGGHEHADREWKCKKENPHSEHPQEREGHGVHEHGVREWKGQRDTTHSDHSAEREGKEAHEQGGLREWKGRKDGHFEYTRGSKEGSESEWKGRRDIHPEYTPKHEGHGDEGRASSSLEVAEKGYIIKVSKELMGLFCYIEKRKRSVIKELVHTLRQIAAVALVLTCVRGILAPLVEVFKTTPPTWSKLLLMLVSLDSVAICYLAIKSSEPLEQLAALATENRADIMEGVEKEEEIILKIATELIRLFKRLRNIAISITVSHTAQLVYTVLRLKDPDFVANCSRVVQTWMLAPWT